jgi:glyoxylase I family protein
MLTRFVHINITSREPKKLAEFYIRVFTCERVRPGRLMNEAQLKTGSGVSNPSIEGEWLRLPGVGPEGPILEIFRWSEIPDRPAPVPNQPGLSHIAFEVDDIEKCCDLFCAAGGRHLGKVANLPRPSGTLKFVNMLDPDGNIVELMQRVPN